VTAYCEALDKLHATPGWEQLNEEQKQRVSAPLVTRANSGSATEQAISLLRTELDACVGLLDKAIEEMLRLVDGSRIVRVSATSYFTGGIESEEQLDQALTGLREECLEFIGAGKKVLVK